MMHCESCCDYEILDSTETSVEALLGRLSVAVRERRLLFVDVAWAGCSGCANVDLGGAIFSDRVRLNSLEAKVAWKDGSDITLPTHKEFKLFIELMRGHQQAFGGDKTVESYPFPPWDRPHFPQLCFIDPRRIDVSSLDALCRLNQGGTLFNNNDDLNLTDSNVRLAVYRTFQQAAVLLQMLNEHLFAVPNDQFQEPEFFASFDCVVDQFRRQPADPESCFRYDRPPAQPRGEYAVPPDAQQIT